MAQQRGVPHRYPDLGDHGVAVTLGADFDEVRSTEGQVLGHVRTLRLLTDAEAAYAAAHGWDALVAAAGSVDALLDVTRNDTVADPGVLGTMPVFLSKLHAEQPPRNYTIEDE